MYLFSFLSCFTVVLVIMLCSFLLHFVSTYGLMTLFSSTFLRLSFWFLCIYYINRSLICGYTGVHICVKSVKVLVAQSCLILCDPMDCSPPGSSVHGDSPGKNTGVGCHALLQGIFPTQGSNPGLLHCRWILYRLSHQESPKEQNWDLHFEQTLSTFPISLEVLSECVLGLGVGLRCPRSVFLSTSVHHAAPYYR